MLPMLVLTGFYFAAVELRDISISASVCLSVRWHISNTIRIQTSRNFLYILAVALGSVFLWRQSN